MDLERLLELVRQPRVIGLIVAALVVLWLLKRLFSRAPASAHHTVARCHSCGWSGQVSKYKPTCPKCANTIRI